MRIFQPQFHWVYFFHVLKFIFRNVMSYLHIFKGFHLGQAVIFDCHIYVGAAKVAVLCFSSIKYVMLDYTSRVCSVKNGTFGTLQMVLNQEVDVVFGPICSEGRLSVACNNKITPINAIKLSTNLYPRSYNRKQSDWTAYCGVMAI